MSNSSNVASAVSESFSTGGAVVESDPAQRSQAMIAHLCGIAGILGTGIFYLVKKSDPKAGPFVQSQVKEAFNFHLAVFAGYIVLMVGMVVLAMISSILAMIVSLATSLVALGILALVILNALKANKGIAAKYPFKIAVLK